MDRPSLVTGEVRDSPFADFERRLSDPDQSMDDVFRALAKQPRRELLVALAEADPREISLDVREDVDVREDGGDSNPTDGSLVDLYHHHLPMLDDDDFVAWNRDAHTVTTGPRFEECAPLLDFVLDECDDEGNLDGTVAGVFDDARETESDEGADTDRG